MAARGTGETRRPRSADSSRSRCQLLPSARMEAKAMDSHSAPGATRTVTSGPVVKARLAMMATMTAKKPAVVTISRVAISMRRSLASTASVPRTNPAGEVGDVGGDPILTLVDTTVDSQSGARVVTFRARARAKDISRMTVEAPPDSPSGAQASPERKPPGKRTRANKRIAVLYNVDFEDACPEIDPMWASRADVALVASGVAAALASSGYAPQLVGVDGDLAGLRSALLEYEPDCAFNLCESLVGDARLESAVPLVLELLDIPFTGSPPEVLAFALRKDRVKKRLEAAGIPTPRGRVLTGPDDPCDLPFPLIVKPVREDGSAGISHASGVI